MTTRQGTTRSGWCLGPPGAVPAHRWCRYQGCGCECHANKPERERALKPEGFDG